MSLVFKPSVWLSSVAVALEGACFAIPITIGSVGLLYAHINDQWILPGVLAALVGMLLMHVVGSQSQRPMVYAVRFMEVATLISFLEIFIEKMPAWGLSDSPSHRLMLVMLVSMGVAIILPLFHALQFARFARLIPLPVFAGFGNAICLTILISQSKVLSSLLQRNEWGIGLLILVTATTAILADHFFKRIPAGVLGLMVGSLMAVLMVSFGHVPLPMIGSYHVDFNIPAWMVPWQDLMGAGVDGWAIAQNVAFASAVVSVVAFLNSVIAEAFITQLDGKRSASTDWISSSLAQCLGVLLGNTALTPSISATRGALNAGALHSSSLIILGLICLLVYASGLLGAIPVAAISGVLLFDAWSNAHRPSLKLTWQFIAQHRTIRSVQKEDLFMVWLVVIAAVFYNMILGVLVGVLGGLILFALRNGRHTVRSIRTGENLHSNCVWSAAEAELLRLHGKETHVVALDGALFFGVADALQSVLKDQLNQCKRLILDFSLVTSLDSAVAMAIHHVLVAANLSKVKVVFCGLEDSGSEVSTTLELSFKLPQCFPDTDRALEWAELDILESSAAYSGGKEALSLYALATMLGLSGHSHAALMNMLDKRTYQPEENIFQRGDFGGEMIFILKGAADVRISGFKGREVRVALYGQGAMVGEMGFLDGKPRSATVTAVSELLVAVLHRSAFDRYAVEHPDGAQKILMHLAMELNSRLRRTNRIL